jgi:hypothetical protein
MLDTIDRQAMAEGQALSDHRQQHGRYPRSRKSKYRIRQQDRALDMSDIEWARMVRKAAEDR